MQSKRKMKPSHHWSFDDVLDFVASSPLRRFEPPLASILKSEVDHLDPPTDLI